MFTLSQSWIFRTMYTLVLCLVTRLSDLSRCRLDSWLQEEGVGIAEGCRFHQQLEVPTASGSHWAWPYQLQQVHLGDSAARGINCAAPPSQDGSTNWSQFWMHWVLRHMARHGFDAWNHSSARVCHMPIFGAMWNCWACTWATDVMYAVCMDVFHRRGHLSQWIVLHWERALAVGFDWFEVSSHTLAMDIQCLRLLVHWIIIDVPCWSALFQAAFSTSIDCSLIEVQYLPLLTWIQYVWIPLNTCIIAYLMNDYWRPLIARRFILRTTWLHCPSLVIVDYCWLLQ